jgi:hypothetical protein
MMRGNSQYNDVNPDQPYGKKRSKQLLPHEKRRLA